MAKKVLVVVDMQNDFIDGALGTKEACAIVSKVVNKIKSRSKEGWVVFATKDTHGEDYLETNEGKHLPVPHCIKGTAGWEIDGYVRKTLFEANYIEVEKRTFGSLSHFDSKDLSMEIRKALGVSPAEIEIVGLCTDICVVSNALILKAEFPESKISVDSACCAGVTPEGHEAALTTMRMCQIDIV